jgi:hypothetical protein
VPFLVDPETLRFGSDAYRDVDRLAALAYAPRAPITSSSSDDDIHRFVTAVLILQAQVDAAAYVAPCLPLDNNGEALKLNRRLAHAARDALGVEVDRRPLIMSVAPATRVLADPVPIAQMLADLPVEQVHVQPLRFRPTELSMATLERYCDYLAALRALGIGVMAGRVGAFGLVLPAIGMDGFDSGLTTAEAFDLNSSIRSARKRRSRHGDEGTTDGARKRRFYLTQLKTTVMAPVVGVIDTPSMRYRFTSSLPCCTAGFGSYLEHAREHCLFARTEESANLMREAPTLRSAVVGTTRGGPRYGWCAHTSKRDVPRGTLQHPHGHVALALIGTIPVPRRGTRPGLRGQCGMGGSTPLVSVQSIVNGASFLRVWAPLHPNVTTRRSKDCHRATIGIHPCKLKRLSARTEMSGCTPTWRAPAAGGTTERDRSRRTAAWLTSCTLVSPKNRARTCSGR